MSRNFSFIVKNVLAGMAQPGPGELLIEDLEFLRKQKIGAIVTLTTIGLEQRTLVEYGFRYTHIPIIDFAAPSMDQIQRFIQFQVSAEKDDISVVVHCAAGLGRTGTFLACALVRRGMTSQAAIDRVRRVRPYSIETTEQEDAIRLYEKYLKRGSDGP